MFFGDYDDEISCMFLVLSFLVSFRIGQSLPFINFCHRFSDNMFFCLFAATLTSKSNYFCIKINIVLNDKTALKIWGSNQ